MQIRAVSTASSVAFLCVSALLAQPDLSGIRANHRAFFPSGDGPFPTVVAIPGCSGVSFDGLERDLRFPQSELTKQK